jgi:hypothetical protein
MTLPLLTIQAFEDRNFKPLFLKNVKVSRSRNIEVISLARQGKAKQSKARIPLTPLLNHLPALTAPV